MALKLNLADGWTMTQLFPILPTETLKALSITGGALHLTTKPFTNPDSGHHLDAGLNLTGTVDLAANYTYLKIILGDAAKLPIDGPISNFQLPLFDFTTSGLKGKLGPVPLSGISLNFASVDLTPTEPTPTAFGQTSLIGSITVGNVAGRIVASLPKDTSSLTLKADFTNLSLASFVDLADYIGPLDPFDALPAPIQTQIKKVGGAFELTHMGLEFDLSNLTFSSVELDARVNLQSFHIFDVIPDLSVDELDLKLSVNNLVKPAAVTFGARAEIDIGSSYAVILSFQTTSNGAYQLQVAQKPGAQLHLDEVLKTFVPGLTDFPEFTVETFGLIILPKDKFFSFNAVIKSNWEIIKTPVLMLTEIDVAAEYNGKLAPPSSGSIHGIFLLEVDNNRDNDVTINLAAVKAKGASGWVLSGNTGPDQPIPVGKAIEGIAKKFTVSNAVPDFISGLIVENLSLSFDTDKRKFDFATEIIMPFSEDVSLDLTVTIGVEPIKPSGYEAKFHGTFLIDKYRFDIVFDHKTAKSDTLIATYQPAQKGSQSISLRDLLNGISPSLGKDIPINITIDLKDVKFVFYKDPVTNKLAFGLDVGIPIDLSKLPIVGNKLPKDFTLAIDDLQGVYATKAISADEMKTINPLLPDGIIPFPEDGLKQGINLTADVTLGSTKKRFVLAGPAPAKGTGGPETSTAALLAGGGPDQPMVGGGAEDGFKWINVNKQLGIFQFNRVGAGYSDNILSVALDAGVSLGPLTLSMDGLSVGSPLDKFDPHFSLNGLGLAFSRPPLTMSGNFLRVPEGKLTSYYGQVTVQVAQLGFMALGGWAPDADPASFFLYAAINAPIGGPPYLFLNGLAGGLGINRTLLLPTMEELPDYILLPNNAPTPEGSPSATVNKVLPQLQKYFQNKKGQYWVAGGVKVSSFEMIDAFVLVTVSFGVDFQLAVLGQCSMSLPPATPNPVAYIQINLVASFTPANGLLSIYGGLTPQSYLFGGFVKLSGGIAFYIWFSGEHAGDFIVSIGGYYPSFKKPANYPDVPRLKIVFALGPINVTGQAYFALTSGAIMAGMGMSAVFKAGPIKAWLDAGLDFLIAWAPFHYEVQVYISVGVSADLGLFTISVSIGADLYVWGPPFGGKADVDLAVISFTIAFGAPQQPPPPIGWKTLKDNFLPKGTPEQKTPGPVDLMMDLGSNTPTETSNIIKMQAKKGLVASDVDGFDWVMSANHFEILLNSTVPANHAKWWQGEDQGTDQEFIIKNAVAAFSHERPKAGEPFLWLPKGTQTHSADQVWNPDIDIAPMDEAKVSSTMKISVKRHRENDPPHTFTSPVTDLAVAPRLERSGTALWKIQNVQDPNAPRNLEKTLVGFALTPEPRHPDKVSDVPLIQLLFAEGNYAHFHYQTPAVVTGYTVTSHIEANHDLVIDIRGRHDAHLTNSGYHLTALVDPWVKDQRADVATALREAGFGTYEANQIDLDVLAKDKTLTDWPLVSQLGA